MSGAWHSSSTTAGNMQAHHHVQGSAACMNGAVCQLAVTFTATVPSELAPCASLACVAATAACGNDW